MSVGGVWEVWKYRRTVYKQAIFIEGYTNSRYFAPQTQPPKKLPTRLEKQAGRGRR